MPGNRKILRRLGLLQTFDFGLENAEHPLSFWPRFPEAADVVRSDGSKPYLLPVTLGNEINIYQIVLLIQDRRNCLPVPFVVRIRGDKIC